MGTMLAQKKPLESIQRSQAINFVAEIFYEEFYKLKYCSTVVYMVPRA